jgi:hypothetical protein
MALLFSVIAGCDVKYRLLLTVRPSSGKTGFHSHCIGGPFGAMIIAGRLLRLSGIAIRPVDRKGRSALNQQ